LNLNAQPTPPENLISHQKRFYVIAAALLTLFLGALDALVMSAAMPTIVTDLGGLHLYSWVYSAYLLARAVSLPVFGKLADIFKSRRLYVISILIFLLGSVLAGLAQSMTQLILSRVLQGIGAGGNFALVYIVLTDISAPENRAKTLSLASFIWGLASVLGPTFGGFVVTYFSWRWIFFINVPLGPVVPAGNCHLPGGSASQKEKCCHRLSRRGNPFNRHPGIADCFPAGRPLLRLGVPSHHRTVSNNHRSGPCILLCRQKSPGTASVPGLFR